MTSFLINHSTMATTAISISQKLSLFLLGIFAGLTGCSKNLEVSSLENSIKIELEKQGGIIVQSVVCPKDVPKAVDAFFQCKGRLLPQGEFVVAVQQEEEAEQLKWEVLNSNGLLNLPRLEKRLQKEVGTEIGTEPTIKCSTGTRQYRSTKPGDSFECKVTNGKLTNPPGQIDKLVVKVDAQGNVNWQQYRTVQAIATSPLPGSASPGSPAVGNAAGKTSASPTKASPSPASTAPSPTAKSAEDLLKDPNATDGFN
ncbi:MAG: hypothetical protein HC781_09970 [Leptolyngbyaceae cyanobacterium CSU_1_4]|nr:hypothetical protein [Leptolyngbyaceae cyanobacterium CSU_1_4]